MKLRAPLILTAIVALGFVVTAIGCSVAMRSTRQVSSGAYAAAPRTIYNYKMTGLEAPAAGSAFAGRNNRGNTAELISPESLPSRDEEVWVIEKKNPSSQDHDPNIPGTGALVAKLPDKPTETVPVPLRHTDVKASIAGYIATVEVRQQFYNPFSSKIEAVYVIPLPENAAVNEFVMTVGTRKIRGIIRERKEAERIYAAAKSQGYVASLMTQERPNIFTQSVANIEPGKEIDVDVKYFHTLAYSDGWYQFVFPMVVGPRFNPSGSTQGVGAVARGAHGTSGQKTEVQYLAPNERSGHDISLAVHLDAGVPVEAVECKTHEIQKSDARGGAVDVKLAANDSLPNRDFVLRYKVAGRTIKSAVVVQRDENGKGGFFTLMLVPPETQRDLPRKPLEMVFTIDVSGSQSGIPLSQEKAAVKYAITHMNAADTFQVIRFGNQAIKLFDKPEPADDAHVSRAVRWIDALDANEGTMLVDGLRASLLFPHDEQRLRYVTFLTDGFIGNEAEAFAEIHQDLGPSRIFSFGSGSSTNRYLLEGMAKMGNGAAAYLGPRDDAREVMAEFLKRISRPAMTDLAIDFGGVKVSDVYPARLGDLYVGKPVTISGRFIGGGKHTIKLKGLIAGEKRENPIAVDFDGATHPGVAAVWARMKIADLAERSTYEPVADLAGQIKSTALEFGLMSSFTAFVAVDSTEKTAGDHGTTVAVPVPVPEGVRYETTVSDPNH